MRRSFEQGSSPTGFTARPSRRFSLQSSGTLSRPGSQPLDEEHGAASTLWREPSITEALLGPPEEAVSHDESMWSELGRLASLAAPLLLQNLFGYSLAIASAVFVGHLEDPVALSSAVLAGSFYNVTGFSLIVGLAAGMETLCGQAYGAGNFRLLGVVLQRALLICWVACIPITLLWQYTENILRFFDQAPDIVYGASRYLKLITPTLYFSVVSSTLYRYLLAQRSVLPPVICTVFTAILCPIYNYYFIFRQQLRLDGAAYAFLLSNVTYALLLAVYVAYREWRLLRTPQRSWPGLTRGAFDGWGIYLSYGVPAAIMICMEWWMFEVVIFLAGSLKDIAEIAVGVMGITFHITSFSYMVPMSIGTATNTRIANELGAGNAQAARRALLTAVLTVAVAQALIASTLYLLRNDLVEIFTKSPEVDSMVIRVMPIVALSVLGDGMNAVLSGTLRGSGRQAIGAALNVIGYWCVGCPVAIVLGFSYQMDVLGFWIGLASATTVQVLVLTACVSRMDWDLEVSRAAALMHLHRHATSESLGNDIAGGDNSVVEAINGGSGHHRSGGITAALSGLPLLPPLLEVGVEPAMAPPQPEDDGLRGGSPEVNGWHQHDQRHQHHGQQQQGPLEHQPHPPQLPLPANGLHPHRLVDIA